MSAQEHPEELIDRARLGALDPDEQLTLHRHLAICAACTGHVTQRLWFERELAPQQSDEILARRALDSAMLRMRPTSSLSRSRSSPRWLRLAAAGVLLASGVTAAATIVVRKISLRTSVASVAPRPLDLRPTRPAAPPPLPPTDAPEPAAEPHPSVLPNRAPAPRPAITAATLFERAGQLRREGRADAAIATYRRLQETFPDAREAQLSFALAGQLLLERGRSGEALAQFDRHPRMGGDVGEEALVGRATALEQLHRTAEAIAAWQSLLDRYPRSIYAARARTRLAQLGDHR